VALGPIILVFVALGLTSWRSRAVPTGPRARRAYHVPILAVGAVAVVALPTWCNWMKFGSPVSIPWSHQVVALDTPSVAAFYRHHAVFGLGYLPSTVGWYLRPWTLLTTGLFPFFGFTTHAEVTSNSHFLAVGRASSIPASMPLLAILTVVGLIILGRSAVIGSDEDADGGRGLRVTVAAAAISGFTVLVFDTVANRYLADLLPLLVAASLVGLNGAGRWWSGRPRPVHWSIGVAVAGLAIYSTLVNLSLGLEEGLVFASSPTPAQKAGLVEWQLSVHKALPVSLSFPVSAGTRAPPHPVPGQLFVQPGCAGVYQYNGPIWNELEVGAAGGRRSLDVQVPRTDGLITEPLMVAGSGTDPASYQYFSIRYGPSDRYRIFYESRPWDAFEGHPVVAATEWQRLAPNRHIQIELTIPGTAPEGAAIAEARIPGIVDFVPGLPVKATATWTVGRFPSGGPAFAGQLEQDPVPTPLCAQVKKAMRP
jgi:hypothetical protein